MIIKPFKAHSKVTNEIYIVCGEEKYIVTKQVIKAMRNTGRLDQQSCDDCVSRQAVLKTIDDCSSDGLKGIFCSYVDGERFKEYIKSLSPVIVEHGNCTDCKYNKSAHSDIVGYTDTYCECGNRNEMRVPESFCCADFERAR